MIDIDFFKQVNDTCGHAAGDQVLVQFSRMLQEQVRAIDIPGRLGGEEFGVLLPSTNLAAALDLAERLRDSAQALINVFGTSVIKVTISTGVAQFCPPMSRLDELLKSADQALYQAKNTGRNRVVYTTETGYIYMK
jgi:diguanylate cyclase (GGDEF)-like protein